MGVSGTAAGVLDARVRGTPGGRSHKKYSITDQRRDIIDILG